MLTEAREKTHRLFTIPVADVAGVSINADEGRERRYSGKVTRLCSIVFLRARGSDTVGVGYIVSRSADYQGQPIAEQDVSSARERVVEAANASS